MTILYIAIGVCAIAIAVYFIRLAMDGRRERRRVREFQQDIAMQERIINPDDDTATWPILPGGENAPGVFMLDGTGRSGSNHRHPACLAAEKRAKGEGRKP